MNKFILVVVAVLLLSVAAQAGPVADGAAKPGGPTPESSLRNGAQIIANARTYQETYCKEPRNNTPAKCAADFEKFIEVSIEGTARHVLFLVAKKNGASTKDVDRLLQDAERLYKAIKESSRSIDRLYMPQSTAPTGQAPGKPKAAALDTR